MVIRIKIMSIHIFMALRMDYTLEKSYREHVNTTYDDRSHPVWVPAARAALR